MATVTITGTSEQLLRMARIITEAANEAQTRGTIVVTIDNSAGAVGSAQVSGGNQRKS
jgi:hypothetical protein